MLKVTLNCNALTFIFTVLNWLFPHFQVQLYQVYLDWDSSLFTSENVHTIYTLIPSPGTWQLSFCFLVLQFNNIRHFLRMDFCSVCLFVTGLFHNVTRNQHLYYTIWLALWWLLQFGFCFCDKDHDQKQFGEERVYLTYISWSHFILKRNQSSPTKAGTWRQVLKHRP